MPFIYKSVKKKSEITEYNNDFYFRIYKKVFRKLKNQCKVKETN